MFLAFAFFVSFFVLWHTATDYSIDATELWSVRVILLFTSLTPGPAYAGPAFLRNSLANN
jgi:hypothetical protein